MLKQFIFFLRTMEIHCRGDLKCLGGKNHLMAINRTDQSKRAIKGDKIGGFCSPLGRAEGKEGGKNKEE